MPQAAIKMFFLNDPNWPQPAPSADDHWYFYGMGRIVLLFLWLRSFV